MLAVVVICLMLASGQGIPLEKLSGQHDYCTWGAEYWCSSVSTAVDCDKADWCITNYWSYDVLQDAPCSVLQQLVSNVRTLAKDSTHSFLTQNEIAVFIVKGCALLQNVESRNQCKQLITDEVILFKLLNLLGSDLTPQSVATAIGVCRRNIPEKQKKSSVACDGLQDCSSSLPVVVKDGTEHQRDRFLPICPICKFVIERIQSILANNATEKLIEAALQMVCKVLPSSIRKQCDALVSNYTAQIIQLLLRYPPELICGVFRLCSDNVLASAIEIQQSPSMKDSKCFLCKLVINQVKSMLSDHTTQDEIKAALEKVCHQLPPVLESVCNDIVETYEPQIIQILLSSFTPEQICEKLNLCTGVQGYVNETQQSPNEIQQSSTGNNTFKCFLCKLIINQVKSKLSDHATQEEIKAALEKVCKVLPPTLTSVCKVVIETYEPQIIQMLLSSLTTAQICSKLKMCTDVQDKSQLLFVPKKNKQSTNLPYKKHCDACLLTLYNFQSTLNNSKWQSESKAVLYGHCGYLQEGQELCQLIIDASFRVIGSFSQAVLFPVELCQRANFCEATDYAAGDGSAPGILVKLVSHLNDASSI